MRADSVTPPNAPLRWRSRSKLFLHGLPTGFTDWLFDAGSLTQRLRSACPGRLRVQVLQQGWGRPNSDETSVLGLRPDAWAWTREVQLLCNAQPWVFARTLIPAATLHGRGRRLTRLGTRPLGEVLFAAPGVRRGPVEVARIVAGQRLHRQAFGHLPELPDAIWGRRSVFWIDKRPLLVCEIFLPDSPAFPARFRPDFLDLR